MKITAGLGSVEEYERFVRDGADEFFCGYVPYEWSEKYGTVMPLNRREVLSYNVQIGSFSEMEILSAMVKEYGRPVHLTFNSLHCDEMGYLCRVPYQLGDVKTEKVQESTKFDKGIQTETELTEVDLEKDISDEIALTEKCRDSDGYLCGETGCGLCALYQLQEAGITHLKLVGRGNYTDFMEKDIRNLRKALDILEHSDSEKTYLSNLQKVFFPDGCSGNCYYR